MRGIFVFVGLILSFVLVQASDVLVGTDATFNNILNENEYVLAEFYAPWCGHCKKLAPEYEKVATALKKDKIVTVKVDATKEKNLASEYKIEGFPTLYFFRKGRKALFRANKNDAESLISLAKTYTGELLPHVSTLKQLKSLQAESPNLFVFAVSKEDQAYEDVVLSLGIGKFAIAVNPNKELLDALKISKAGFFVALNEFEPTHRNMAIDNSDPNLVKNLISFAKRTSVPLVARFGSDAAGVFELPNVSVVFIMDKEEAFTEEYKKQILDIALKLDDKLYFLLATAESKELMEHFGFKAEQLPTAVIYSLAENKKYGDPKFEYSLDNIEKLCKEHLDGKIPLITKSEPEPATNDGPVRILTGNSFESEVKNFNKYMLVKFYAPWCGHCKQLAPIYEDLGKWAKEHRTDITIAKVDSTANDIYSANVAGFPTLKLYKSKTGEVVDYSGERNLKSLKEFLQKEAI